MRAWPLYQHFVCLFLSRAILSPGPRDVEGNRRGEVPGVLGADAEGAQDGVRRGDPRRAVPRAAGQGEAEVLHTVRIATRQVYIIIFIFIA